MNFELSEDQRAIREAFARFVDERVVPQAAALDEAHAFPRELFAELGSLGFFGMRYPEALGGSGLALPEFALALEEIARGSMSLAGAAAMQSLMGTKFLQLLGNADIVERLFKPALSGAKIGAICMTEPGAGSISAASRPPPPRSTAAGGCAGARPGSPRRRWPTSSPSSPRSAAAGPRAS